MLWRKSKEDKAFELLIQKTHEVALKAARVELKNAKVQLKINTLTLKLITDVFDLDRKRKRRYII